MSSSNGTLRCDHGLRRQTIVESILSDVFQGRLQTGAHLVTQELAARFGVSHTPIREALITLAGIGIIDLLPNRGAVVREVTKHEVREICQVRKVLECEATRLALPGHIDASLNCTPSATSVRAVDGRRQPFRGRFIPEARAVDSRLHDLIAESSGNVFLAKEIGRLKILFRSFRDVAWQHDEDHSDFNRFEVESLANTLAIVEALYCGRSEGSGSHFMARHIRSGVKYWSRALAKKPTTNSGAIAALAASQKSEKGTSMKRRA